jgi:(S)-2-hydroxyglutarate dehydrogenase
VGSEAVGVVGGGIIGLAIAREVALRRPGTRVVVLEKEDRVGAHQTGHNSGVVHAGIYYRPGSLKAELCTRGRLLLRDYCAAHSLPYDERGKLVVAVDSSELGRLDALERSARDNSVPGLRRIDGPEITSIEPHVTGLAALHSPETAVTDFVAVVEALAEDVRTAGGEVLLGTPVVGLDRLDHREGAGHRWRVQTPAEPHLFDRLVVCAGLQADRVGRWADGQPSPRIVPFRGEYLSVVPEKQELVRGLVYPVPDPRYPFLGVHFTRRVTGELELGPNAVLALAREGYGRGDLRWADVRDVLTWPGSWRMAARHWRTGVREVRGSLSVSTYLRDAQRYVPDLRREDVVRGRCGIRAQAVDRDGELVDDFRIHQVDGVTTIRNAPSPAATSSLAIAEHVVARLWG